MFCSPEETLDNLERTGYFSDLKTATAVFLAGKIHRPILLEGPAGAGKTQLAESVAKAYGAPLLRLQCYEGINEEKAIGQYDRSLQELYVLLMSKSSQTPDWEEIKREVTSRAFFMAGPLLEAIEHENRCVLLIDEIDKVGYAFEAMLLELLSAWTLSIPKLGTVHATSIPHVFLTSNQERHLGDLLCHHDDQPSVGIILCKSKNAIIAEYALRDATRPIGVSEYRLTTSLPTNLRGNLPTTKELEAELKRGNTK